MAFQLDTKDIQRSLLKLLMTDVIALRKHGSSIKEDWFTTDPRKFIFKKIVETSKTSNGLSARYTDKLFQFDLNNQIPVEEQTPYTAEWKYVTNYPLGVETIEALSEKLIEKEMSDKVGQIIADAYETTNKGQVYQAISDMYAHLVGIGKKDNNPMVALQDYKIIDDLMVNKVLYPEQFAGIPIGFPTFDLRTGGIFPEELTLFVAITGVGKSTILKQIGYNIISRKKNVLHITNEESRNQVLMKYLSLIMQIPYHHIKNPKHLTDKEKDLWQRRVKAFFSNPLYGRLFIKEIPSQTTVHEIEKVVVDCECNGHKIDVIMIDYMDLMRPVEKAHDENDEQAKISADVKNLALRFDVPVISVSQAATIAEAKQDRGAKFGKYDVYGSKRKVHATNTLAYIREDGRDEKQLKDVGGDRETLNDVDRFWAIDVAKNRDGPYFDFKCRQHVQTGKVEEVNKNTIQNNQLMDEVNSIFLEAKNAQAVVQAPEPEPLDEELLEPQSEPDEYDINPKEFLAKIERNYKETGKVMQVQKIKPIEGFVFKKPQI